MKVVRRMSYHGRQIQELLSGLLFLVLAEATTKPGSELPSIDTTILHSHSRDSGWFSAVWSIIEMKVWESDYLGWSASYTPHIFRFRYFPISSHRKTKTKQRSRDEKEAEEHERTNEPTEVNFFSERVSSLGTQSTELLEYFQNTEIDVRREDQRFECWNIFKDLFMIEKEDLLQTFDDPFQPWRGDRIHILAFTFVQEVT